MVHLWALYFGLGVAITPTLQEDIDTQILSLYHGKFNGDGTYYGEGANRGGLCQYYPPGLPLAGRYPGMRSAALNSPQIYNSIGCGMCFRVHGTGDGLGHTPIVGVSYAFIDDICPGCHEGDLDFSEDGDGRWDIGIQAVQCPVGDTNIEYKFQGSHEWYIKLQIRNHRIPITHLELFQTKMNKFSPLKHTLDGFWELDPSQTWEKPLDTPMVIRMTAANGEVLQDVIDAIQNDVAIPGTVQVSFDSSLPSMTETPNPGPPTTPKPGSSINPNPTAELSPTTANSPPTIKQGTPNIPKGRDNPAATQAPTTNSPGKDILDLYLRNHTGFAFRAAFQSDRGNGLCQYSPPALPPVANSSFIRTTTGLSSSLMYGSLACGTCFKAHATGGGFRNAELPEDFYVFVDDVCAGCSGGSLTLAEPGNGKWDLSISAVQCPVGDTKIEYKFQGSNEWYIKLQTRNHRIPIIHMELFQKKMNKFSPLNHTRDGFWELDENELWTIPLEVPLILRMTSANGEVLEDVIDAISNDVVIPGNVQVSLDPSLPSIAESSNSPNPQSTSRPSTTTEPTRATAKPSNTSRHRSRQRNTPSDAGIMDLYHNNYFGFATFSGNPGGTLCQYSPPALPPVANSSFIRTTAGLSGSLMHGSLACGTCFNVSHTQVVPDLGTGWQFLVEEDAHATGAGTGNTPLPGDFYVFVDNVCQGCPGGSLNLAEAGDGRWGLEISAVQCPVGETKLEYKFQGSSPWYIKLQIRNHRVPITGVRLYQKTAQKRKWTPLKHTTDGFWEMDPDEHWKTPLSLPLRIRMESATGAVLKDVIKIIENEIAIPGRVQVPYDPNLPSVATGNDLGSSHSVTPNCQDLPRGKQRRDCRKALRQQQQQKKRH